MQSRQRGVGLFSGLVIVLGVAYVVLRLAPIAIESYRINDSLSSSHSRAATDHLTGHAARDVLRASFKMNDISAITAEEVLIGADGSFSVEYTQCEPLFGDFSLCATKTLTAP